MTKNDEIMASAWWFCSHNGVHPGPNRICGAPCGSCKHKARGALEAAERVRNSITQRNINHDDHPDWTHPLIREDRPE